MAKEQNACFYIFGDRISFLLSFKLLDFSGSCGKYHVLSRYFYLLRFCETLQLVFFTSFSKQLLTGKFFYNVSKMPGIFFCQHYCVDV